MANLRFGSQLADGRAKFPGGSSGAGPPEPGSASYLVQAEDGTSKFTLGDDSGFLLLAESA